MQRTPKALDSDMVSTRQEVKTLLKWTIALVAIIGLPWGGCALLEHRARLSYIPAALAASNVLYVSERIPGFGPGDESTVFVIYEMPESVAERLQATGLPYLQQLGASSPSSDWDSTYADWRPTPLTLTDRWSPPSFEGKKYWISPGIGDFLMHGPDIAMDAEQEKFVNDAIFAPGSYYGYGQSGQLIILVPQGRRIIYAHAG